MDINEFREKVEQLIYALNWQETARNIDSLEHSIATKEVARQREIVKSALDKVNEP